MNFDLQVEYLKNHLDLRGALESGNKDEAIRILTEIVQQDELHEPAFFLLSQCYINKDELFPALRCLKRCRELKSKNINVYRSLSDLYNKLYVLDLARQYMQILIVSEGLEDEEIFMNYVSVLMKMGRDDEAIEFLEKKCTEYQESDVLQAALALNCLITHENKPNKYNKAKYIVEKLARKGSPLAEKLKKELESYNYEADIEENKKNKGKAQEHLGLADQHIANNDLKSAMAEFWTALDQDPQIAIAYTDLGAIYDNLGFMEEGFALHQYAIHLDPNLAIAHNNLGYILNVMGKVDEAIKAYERALELDPNLVVALNSLGTTYDNLGDFEKGISMFRKSLEIEPNKPSTLHDMAFALRALGRYDEARKYLERTIQVDPNWILPKIDRAGLYLALDCPNEAETQLLEVIKIEPNTLGAWIQLAHCYGRMGDGHRFSEALKKVISIPPSNPDDIFDSAELFDRVDQKRAVELWKLYILESGRIRLHPTRVEHARKRIEQIEGTVM